MLRVSRDISACAPGVEIGKWIWRVDDSYVSIGLEFGRSSVDSQKSFLEGRGLTTEDDEGGVTVWIAATVQENLAGIAGVAWPKDAHGRILAATMHEQTATWVNRAGEPVVRIGELAGS